MGFFVTLTFDLQGQRDYAQAYAALAAINLVRTLTSDSGAKVTLPTTTVGGTFTGKNAATIAVDIRARARAAFRSAGLKGEIFVSVGENWAWAHHEDPKPAPKTMPSLSPAASRAVLALLGRSPQSLTRTLLSRSRTLLDGTRP
jgi:hypothetical protein